MRLRFEGLLLFLVVPAALYLLLAQPVHPLGSIVVAVLLLFGHRFLADPFIDRTIDRRCLWTGAEIAPGCGYRVVSGGTERVFHCYTDQKRESAAKFLTFTQRFAWPLRAIVFGSIGYYVGAEVARTLDVPNAVPHDVNVIILEGVLGLTALATVVAYRFVKPIPHHAPAPVRFPFAVHHVALLGIFWTLVAYGIAGAIGVGQATTALIARLGASS